MSDGRFRVLTADPPWKFDDRLPGEGRGAERHYRTMSVFDICAFPIPEMLPDSILFLWRVSSMVEAAYKVVRAWGFEPKSELIWQKLTATGKEHFGMGRYVRASHETCIIATSGRMTDKIKSRSVRSIFSAPVGRHSEKPERFFDLVEEMVEGPYAELFARRRRPGWTCFGDELPREAGK